ncbi:general secretion pathway protein GspM [Lysobacter sp. H21R4]|uniref:type II secretion system protein GspM n=1 Tax=Lysobacter sp. H21R4 TaxID=2781021 RepID=UPI00188798A5|nr:type II secretion system protein GspM [Lysobacter sp. H21R4]QOY63124.1 general secretion pathway protein GspM [Lysobacter sp. H21R4]
MRLHHATAEVPSRRDRWLAAGLLLAVLAIAYGVLVHPWWTVPMREADARIESLQQRELRLRMQLQQAPQVAARLQQVREQYADTPGFLPETNAELATASLIQRLETVVAEASPGNRSCAITNRSPLDSDNRQSYRRVVAQVRLRCGTPELSRVLYLLESGSPRLFVDNLNILTETLYLSRNQSVDMGGLDVSFDLAGYLLPLDAPTTAGVSDAP